MCLLKTTPNVSLLYIQTYENECWKKWIWSDRSNRSEISSFPWEKYNNTESFGIQDKNWKRKSTILQLANSSKYQGRIKVNKFAEFHFLRKRFFLHDLDPQILKKHIFIELLNCISHGSSFFHYLEPLSIKKARVYRIAELHFSRKCSFAWPWNVKMTIYVHTNLHFEVCGGLSFTNTVPAVSHPRWVGLPYVPVWPVVPIWITGPGVPAGLTFCPGKKF